MSTDDAITLHAAPTSSSKRRKDTQEGTEKKRRKHKHDSKDDEHRKEKKKKKRSKDTDTNDEIEEVNGEEAQSQRQPQSDSPTRTNPHTSTTSPTKPTSKPKSPFHHQRTALYLPISPIYQLDPLPGLIAEHISPLLLTYYEPLNGIILSYTNVHLSNDPPKSSKSSSASSSSVQIYADTVDEYGVSYVWLTADFTVLRPERGAEVEGFVTVQSESHVGVICWNFFNASISSEQLPGSWKWVAGGRRRNERNRGRMVGWAGSEGVDGEIEEGGDVEMEGVGVSGDTDGGRDGDGDEEAGEQDGHYVDGDGKAVKGLIKFRVLDFENLPTFGRDKNFISIEGSLLLE